MGFPGRTPPAKAAPTRFASMAPRAATTDVTIDGATNTTAYYNQDAGIPGVESVQEFRVYTDAYAPEFGRTSGGLVTYALHTGPIISTGRSSSTTRTRISTPMATTPITTPITPRGHFGRNQYGATLGGPVMIPKLYNGMRRRSSLSRTKGFGTPVPDLSPEPCPRLWKAPAISRRPWTPREI